ncbi:putative succinate dehydrogenase subunit 6 [Helianthus debilis subsp. tardiflorus]
MATEGASEQSLFQGVKDFWSERFRILDSYHPYLRRENPLPLWSAADVQEFIASDPVHGPVVCTL